MDIKYNNIEDTLYPVEHYRLRSAAKNETHEIELINLGENKDGNNFAFNIKLEDETVPAKLRNCSSTSPEIITDLEMIPHKLTTKEITLQFAIDVIGNIEKTFSKK